MNPNYSFITFSDFEELSEQTRAELASKTDTFVIGYDGAGYKKVSLSSLFKATEDEISAHEEELDKLGTTEILNLTIAAGQVQTPPNGFRGGREYTLDLPASGSVSFTPELTSPENTSFEFKLVCNIPATSTAFIEFPASWTYLTEFEDITSTEAKVYCYIVTVENRQGVQKVSYFCEYQAVIPED